MTGLWSRFLDFMSGSLITTEYEITIEDPANRPRRPVKIALLADWHDHAGRRRADDLLTGIGQFDPDFVLCAGDMVTAKAGSGHMDHALRLLEQLCARWPVYLSDGNHESRFRRWPEVYPGMFRRYLGALSDMGAVLLDNRSRMVRAGGMRIALSGFVQDLAAYNRIHPGKIRVEDLKAVMDLVPDADEHLYHILIAHMPDHFDAYAKWGADLTVAGHLHGGIIRLSFLGGLFGSSLRPFPAYDRGMFVKEGEGGRTSRMIVSAGLGSHTLAVRVNNPPELVLIRLKG